MKNLFSLVLLACATLGFAQETVVTPSQPNGWYFGTSSPFQRNSAGWFVGQMNQMPQLGNGDLWLYSGRGDGLSYGQTKLYRGTLLNSISRLTYSTFTPRGLQNIAPTMNLCIDIDGDNKGDIWLEYNPCLNGLTIPKGRWTTWAPLQGLWWNNKSGVKDMRSLGNWLSVYPNAKLDIISMQAGTWDAEAGGYWGSAWYGVDNVNVITGVSSEMNYNFEPDELVVAQSQKPVPVPVVGGEGKPLPKPPTNSTTNVFTWINALWFEYPTYYINEGEQVGKKPTADAAKPSAYQSADELYVPLTFEGNITIKQALSKLNGVGNPDAKSTNEPKITEGGAFLFGRVPFYFPKDKNNVWDADFFTDNNSHSLSIKAGLDNVTEVHTIMNLTYAYSEDIKVLVEFLGSKGAIYRKELKLNRDIRDMCTSSFDKIELPTHAIWVRPTPGRGEHNSMFLDSQVFKLPAEFATQELKSITIIDNGGHQKQRVFVVGVTAKIKLGKIDK
jgi:hypothetical protein